ncbi:facilitated trehalose transporter Tret1-like [Chrysoperla carnea]|uniref:facilitated trehalose transporter Tret1-like n=1 Tax=Chrysoperla carnea TaxID=189513 RepID=UPI001D075CA7|nr:facilitated trehalose transporter Tret1-like [Chrysoperla carnea]
MEESVWVIGFLQCGFLPGSIVASMITDHYGRKKTILMTSIPFILSSLISIYAESVIHYYIARFLGGFGLGANSVVVSVYISEISSPKISGILSTSIHLALSVGILFAFVLGAYLSIVTYCSVLIIFPIIQLIFTFYLPETPYFQVMKQDYNGAEKTLRFLRKKSNVRDELNRLIEGYEEETSKKKQLFWDLFRDRTNLQSVFIITVLRAAQVFTGFTAINGYSQVIFEDGHSIERFGRRIILMTSGIITLIPLTMLGVYFYLQDNIHFVYIEHLRLIPLISIALFKFSFGIGLNAIPYILAVELFPTSVKSYASSLNAICLAVFGVLANKVYQVVLKEFNYPGAFATIDKKRVNHGS